MLTLIKIATGFLTGVSAYTTYVGFETISPKPIPLFMALAAWISCITLWFALFSWYPIAKDATRKKLNVGIGFALVIIFGLSTIWSVMGLGGNAAIIHHMNKTVKQAEETLTGLTAQVEKEVSLSIIAKTLSKQFTGLRDIEEKGAFSSYTGRGEVVMQLESISNTLNNLNNTVVTNIANRRKAVEDAKEAIYSLRDIVGALIDVPTKMKKFSIKLSTMNQLFQRIYSADTTRLVKEISKQLGGISATQRPTGDTRLAEAQKNALIRLEETQKVAERIISKFIEDTELERVEIKPLTAIDVGNACTRYFYVILPAWAGSIALDFLPLLLVFILFWTVEERQEKEIEKDLE